MSKTQLIRQLLENPLVKQTIGQIWLRLNGPASPFFAPLIKIGSVAAVVSAALVLLRDQIAPVLGLHLPPVAVLAIEIIGWISGTIASMSALTLNDEGVKQLNDYLGKGDAS